MIDGRFYDTEDDFYYKQMRRSMSETDKYLDDKIDDCFSECMEAIRGLSLRLSIVAHLLSMPIKEEPTQ
jgi:hypothetical protein